MRYRTKLLIAVTLVAIAGAVASLKSGLERPASDHTRPPVSTTDPPSGKSAIDSTSILAPNSPLSSETSGSIQSPSSSSLSEAYAAIVAALPVSSAWIQEGRKLAAFEDELFDLPTPERSALLAEWLRRAMTEAETCLLCLLISRVAPDDRSLIVQLATRSRGRGRATILNTLGYRPAADAFEERELFWRGLLLRGEFPLSSADPRDPNELSPEELDGLGYYEDSRRLLEDATEIRDVVALLQSEPPTTEMVSALRIVPVSDDVARIALRAVDSLGMSDEARRRAMFIVLQSRTPWLGEVVANWLVEDAFPVDRNTLIHQLVYLPIPPGRKREAIARELSRADHGYGVSQDAVACLFSCGTVDSARTIQTWYERNADDRIAVLKAISQTLPTANQVQPTLDILEHAVFQADPRIAKAGLAAMQAILERTLSLPKDSQSRRLVAAQVESIIARAEFTDSEARAAVSKIHALASQALAQ